MPQAVAQHISPTKLAKLSALDTLDAYNARMKYAVTALRFTDACDLMGQDELTGIPRGCEELADDEMRSICLRMLLQMNELATHLFSIASGAAKSGEAR